MRRLFTLSLGTFFGILGFFGGIGFAGGVLDFHDGDEGKTLAIATATGAVVGMGTVVLASKVFTRFLAKSKAAVAVALMLAAASAWVFFRIASH